MVDVAHHRDYRWAWRLQLGVVVVAVVEQRLQLHLFLLTRVDEQNLGADFEGKQLHLLVGERDGRRDHLAVFKQVTNNVGRRAIQFWREFLRR